MGKRIQRQEPEKVTVEIVGSVKYNGRFVPVGERIVVHIEEAARLIASGHAVSIQNSEGKIHNGDVGVPGEEGTDAG